MPAAPVLATHETGGRLAPRRVALRLPGEAAPVEGAWGDAPEFGDFALEFAHRSQGARARIDVALRPRGDRPRALDALVLGFDWAGAPEGVRVLQHGWRSDSDAGPRALDEATANPPQAYAPTPADRAGWCVSDQWILIGAEAGGPVALLGAYGAGRSFAQVYARRERTGVALEIEVELASEIPTDGSCVLEGVELALGDDPAALLEGFGDRWGSDAGARVWRPVPSVWSFSASAGSRIDAQQVSRAAQSLAAQRESLPIEVFQIASLAAREAGDWLECDARFPQGLAALADELRDAGFVAGLWSAPLCAAPGSAIFREHPDWFLQRRGRALEVELPSLPGALHVLDPSRDEVLEHLETLARTLVECGFFHLEFDASWAAALADGSDPAIAPAARVRRALAALRRGAGEEAFLHGGGAPVASAVGVVDALRVAAPGRAGLGAALARAWMHRRLWLNDAGAVSIDGEGSAGDVAGLAVSALLGTVIGARATAEPLSGAARARLADAIAWSRELDRGIPPSARVVRPLAEPAPAEIALDEAQARTLALVNADPRRRDAPPPDPGTVSILDGGLAPEPGAAFEPHAGALWRSTRDVRLAIFCDFDGTFSVQDVGATLAQRFAAERRPAQWARYERGEITPWEYNLEILDGLPVDRATLDDFLAGVDLDPGAAALLEWCGVQRVPFRILSDGFDWNLNCLQILNRLRFAYTANRLRIERGRWRIAAGAPDPACGCGTGTCKGGILRRYREARPKTHLVHIGNGRVSDSCGAVAADTAFAKDSLAESLAARGVPFLGFETLHDVIAQLDALGPRA